MAKQKSPRWALSQPWFIWLNLALTAIAAALLYYYVPTRASCSTTAAYNSTLLVKPTRRADGEVWHTIRVVTDLDHDSKIANAKKPTWRSIMKGGILKIAANGESARVEWRDDEDVELRGEFALGGRAMELSDLAVFNGHLISADDRTGMLYAISPQTNIIPWVLLNDGPGNTTKGLKAEWLTVRDKHLYVGGIGKEWTTTTGDFQNYNPMWIKKVSTNGGVEHIDWTKQFLAIRRAIGIDWPGYMIHEAVQWSDVHQRWFFAPRRASKEIYDEAADETRGTNLLLVADDSFTHIDVHHIGALGDGARGYSAFKFVPGTRDDLIVALKSEEKDGRPVGSYLSVFRYSDGRILLNDTKLHGSYKFEGIEFA